MKKVAVFASGTGSNFENLVISQKGIENCNYSIELLIVDKKDAKAIEKSNKLGIPVYFIDPKLYQKKELFEEAVLTILKESSIEFIALAGYMRILGATILNCYKDRVVNIHPSFLPEYPGKDSICRAFSDKCKTTGVTLHYVDSGVDTGKIIYQERIHIDPLWSLLHLEESVHEIEHKIYPYVLNKICKIF